jgi:hypothetical protein
VGAPLLRCICVVLTDRAQRIGQIDTKGAEVRAVESAITSAAWANHIDADSEALSCRTRVIASHQRVERVSVENTGTLVQAAGAHARRLQGRTGEKHNENGSSKRKGRRDEVEHTNQRDGPDPISLCRLG